MVAVTPPKQKKGVDTKALKGIGVGLTTDIPGGIVDVSRMVADLPGPKLPGVASLISGLGQLGQFLPENFSDYLAKKVYGVEEETLKDPAFQQGRLAAIAVGGPAGLAARSSQAARMFSALSAGRPLTRGEEVAQAGEEAIDVLYGIFPTTGEVSKPVKKIDKGDVLNQEQFFEAMGEEGARLEYERINDLLFKYEDKNNRAALEMAFADPDYTQYKDVLDANLLRMYPDGKIPLERITNYAEVMNQGAKKKIQKTVFDIEDIVFAGNDAERELIVNLNGDLRSFSLPKEIEPLQEGIAGLLPSPKTTGTKIVERKPKEENIEFLGLKREDVFKTITKPDGSTLEVTNQKVLKKAREKKANDLLDQGKTIEEVKEIYASQGIPSGGISSLQVENPFEINMAAIPKKDVEAPDIDLYKRSVSGFEAPEKIYGGEVVSYSPTLTALKGLTYDGKLSKKSFRAKQFLNQTQNIKGVQDEIKDTGFQQELLANPEAIYTPEELKQLYNTKTPQPFVRLFRVSKMESDTKRPPDDPLYIDPSVLAPGGRLNRSGIYEAGEMAGLTGGFKDKFINRSIMQMNQSVKEEATDGFVMTVADPDADIKFPDGSIINTKAMRNRLEDNHYTQVEGQIGHARGVIIPFLDESTGQVKTGAYVGELQSNNARFQDGRHRSSRAFNDGNPITKTEDFLKVREKRPDLLIPYTTKADEFLRKAFDIQDTTAGVLKEAKRIEKIKQSLTGDVIKNYGTIDDEFTKNFGSFVTAASLKRLQDTDTLKIGDFELKKEDLSESYLDRLSQKAPQVRDKELINISGMMNIQNISRNIPILNDVKPFDVNERYGGLFGDVTRRRELDDYYLKEGGFAEIKNSLKRSSNLKTDTFKERVALKKMLELPPNENPFEDILKIIETKVKEYDKRVKELGDEKQFPHTKFYMTKVGTDINIPEIMEQPKNREKMIKSLDNFGMSEMNASLERIVGQFDAMIKKHGEQSSPHMADVTDQLIDPKNNRIQQGDTVSDYDFKDFVDKHSKNPREYRAFSNPDAFKELNPQEYLTTLMEAIIGSTAKKIFRDLVTNEVVNSDEYAQFIRKLKPEEVTLSYIVGADSLTSGVGIDRPYATFPFDGPGVYSKNDFARNLLKNKTKKLLNPAAVLTNRSKELDQKLKEKFNEKLNELEKFSGMSFRVMKGNTAVVKDNKSLSSYNAGDHVPFNENSRQSIVGEESVNYKWVEKDTIDEFIPPALNNFLDDDYIRAAKKDLKSIGFPSDRLRDYYTQAFTSFAPLYKRADLINEGYEKIRQSQRIPTPTTKQIEEAEQRFEKILSQPENEYPKLAYQVFKDMQSGKNGFVKPTPFRDEADHNRFLVRALLKQFAKHEPDIDSVFFISGKEAFNARMESSDAVLKSYELFYDNPVNKALKEVQLVDKDKIIKDTTLKKVDGQPYRPSENLYALGRDQDLVVKEVMLNKKSSKSIDAARGTPTKTEATELRNQLIDKPIRRAKGGLIHLGIGKMAREML